MKKILFYSTSLLLIIFFVVVFDFILSNTMLNSKNCYIYQKHYYELKKNCVGKERFKKSFPSINIYTDKLGLRVSKKLIKKDNNKDNIFILGDSFTYGTGLKYKNTYVGYIEKKLKEYNIYNFGVSSYSPSVYLYKIHEALNLGINPKKIIISLDLSDVLDETQRWDYDQIKHQVKTKKSEKNNHFKNDSFKQQNFKLINEFAALLNFNLRIFKSRIANTFRKNEKNFKVKTSFQANFTYTKLNNLDVRFWQDKDLEKGVFKIKSVFQKIEDLSVERGFELYLVIYPWAETLEFGQEAFNWSKFGKELCSKKTCTLIDAIPEFENFKRKDVNWVNKLYFVNDVNFNKSGSKLLSEFIIKNISD